MNGAGVHVAVAYLQQEGTLPLTLTRNILRSIPFTIITMTYHDVAMRSYPAIIHESANSHNRISYS